jgi:hypothetical protein
MLGGDVMVSSADPLTGAPVSVTFRGGHASWDPVPLQNQDSSLSWAFTGVRRLGRTR